MKFPASECNNRGHLLELAFYERIVGLSGIRNIFHESDLRRLYGWNAASIDFLLELDSGIVPIQCKYRNTRRREDNGISNFVKSIEYICERCERPLLFGMWISRLEPFDDNKEVLRNYNIDTVSIFGSIEELSSRAYDSLVSRIAVTF